MINLICLYLASVPFLTHKFDVLRDNRSIFGLYVLLMKLFLKDAFLGMYMRDDRWALSILCFYSG